MRSGSKFSFDNLNPLNLHQLHNSSLLNNQSTKIDLGKTALNEKISGHCTLGIILDPYQVCSDANRSDNQFLIEAEITQNEEIKNGKICEVYAFNSGM